MTSPADLVTLLVSGSDRRGIVAALALAMKYRLAYGQSAAFS